MNTQDLETIINEAFETRSQGFSDKDRINAAVQEAIAAIALLDSGNARVAEQRGSDWHVNQWLKKAVLLSFALSDNKVIESGHSRFYDKVPMKYADYTAEQFAADGVRVVPDAIVRRGAYVAPDVVLMPSYRPSEAALKLARMYTCPAALALVAYWNPCRPDQQ